MKNDMKPELFPIPGFEGKYSATKDGRVFSHNRLVAVLGSNRIIKAKWLKPNKMTENYHVFSLYNSLSEAKSFSLEQIMEMTFDKNNLVPKTDNTSCLIIFFT